MERCPLDKYMEIEDKTKSEVSDELMVSLSTVYSWLKGETKPSHGNMRNVARLLNMSPARLRKDWHNWLEYKKEKDDERKEDSNGKVFGLRSSKTE